MSFTLATWNINSVRLREDLVLKLLSEQAPDVLCLQECKSPVEKIPTAGFEALGYTHMVARGQKGYNGVAILSKIPMVEAGAEDFASLGHARHIAGRLENGVTIHNHYVPAGGDVADRDVNEKLAKSWIISEICVTRSGRHHRSGLFWSVILILPRVRTMSGTIKSFSKSSATRLSK